MRRCARVGIYARESFLKTIRGAIIFLKMCAGAARIGRIISRSLSAGLDDRIRPCHATRFMRRLFIVSLSSMKIENMLKREKTRKRLQARNIHTYLRDRYT